jgi:hypothetical protein
MGQECWFPLEAIPFFTLPAQGFVYIHSLSMNYYLVNIKSEIIYDFLTFLLHIPKIK